MLRSDCADDTRRLYEMLRDNPELDGSIEFHDGIITWDRGGKVHLVISMDAVDVMWGRYESITHWHPDDSTVEELYQMICLMGKKGNVLVVRDAFLWQDILYYGPADGYTAQRMKRHHFGRKFVFGESDKQW